ncbi:SOS response-associated peptidase [Pararhizobium mangrovi]|uniref:Abasic site processing protein n=1 Tax=Pararhizobium mangrovi TaxID=2590452 RepID=A0A506UFZ5_9HYPH|nr:SOS response-associated peptidase [Pararhizobium mangrovi]TPW32015.1 SOS response-associated peptidase [Pararhizobium mangrovi]
MCGRFALTDPPEAVEALFDLSDIEAFPPRYNIAPSQPILLVTHGENPSRPRERHAQLARWGLLPSWVKDPKTFPLLFNARSESAAEKASFRAAMRHRRVLVPASGFYEWQRSAKGRRAQPYWVRPAAAGPIAFAGLMETLHSADGSELDTVAIVTTAANRSFAAIHDRMPVTVARRDFARWLDCRQYAPNDVADLMRPAADEAFEAIPVSSRVNAAANIDPDIQKPVDVTEPSGHETDPNAAREETPQDRASAHTGHQLPLFDEG